MSSTDSKAAVIQLLKGSKATTGYYGLIDVLANTDGIWDEILAKTPYSTDDRARRLARLNEVGKTQGSTEPKIPVYGEARRTNRKYPAVEVYRNGFRQGMSPLGYELDVQDDADENPLKFQTEAFVGGIEQLKIMVIAIEPTMRDDLYLAVRELLYRGIGYFSSLCAVGFNIISARDGQIPLMDTPQQIASVVEIDLQFFTEISWLERNDRAGKVNHSFKIVQYSDVLP